MLPRRPRLGLERARPLGLGAEPAPLGAAQDAPRQGVHVEGRERPRGGAGRGGAGRDGARGLRPRSRSREAQRTRYGRSAPEGGACLARKASSTRTTSGGTCLPRIPSSADRQ